MSTIQWFVLSLMIISNIAQQVAITKGKDGITFWYNSRNTHVATYTFDFCDIVPCPSIPEQYLPLALRSLKSGPQIIGTMAATGDPTYEDTLATETGFSDLNVWLEWMKYNVQESNKTNCYVCGHARPHLGTVPLTIPLQEGKCFLKLFKGYSHTDECEQWRNTYPVSLGDIYWLCGDMKLRVRLSGVWRGECTLAKAIMPLHIVPTYYDANLPNAPPNKV
ncbi:uncharacterized protein O3C94_008474 [Discoglossus pictus]